MKQIEQFNERMNQLESKFSEFQNTSISNEIKLKNKIKEFESIQNEQQKQITNLQTLYKNKENENIQINKKLNMIEQKYLEIKNQDELKNENKIKPVIENERDKNQIKSFNFYEKKLKSFNAKLNKLPYNGIFNQLSLLCDNKNICEIGVIDITGNNHQRSIPFSKIVDFKYNGVCYSSANQHDSYIRFDFKNHSVMVSAYTICSSNQSDPDFLQSWVLEGSNDLVKWINLDSHYKDTSLCNLSISCVFAVSKPNVGNFKYIQLRMTGPSMQNSNVLEISRIELFGTFY